MQPKVRHHDRSMEHGSRSTKRIIRSLRKDVDALLQAILDKYRPDLKPFEAIYRHLHGNSGLSRREKQTAALAAEHPKHLNFEIYTNIGGYGVAGILRNGPDTTILLRGDMDALSVEEKTGLSYTAKKTAMDIKGIQTPVMHACGHDRRQSYCCRDAPPQCERAVERKDNLYLPTYRRAFKWCKGHRRRWTL